MKQHIDGYPPRRRVDWLFLGFWVGYFALLYYLVCLPALRWAHRMGLL